MKCTPLIFAFLFTSILYSQNTVNTSSSLDDQFKKLYKTSNNYQEYKVVLKENFTLLHKNTVDSIKEFNRKLTSKSELIGNQQQKIKQLEQEKLKAVSNFKEAKLNEGMISLFGFSLKKETYNMAILGLLFLLTFGLSLYIYKFKNCNRVTKKAIYNLKDVESEFSLFRKTALKREQKIRRELQDEILKNKALSA